MTGASRKIISTVLGWVETARSCVMNPKDPKTHLGGLRWVHTGMWELADG